MLVIGEAISRIRATLVGRWQALLRIQAQVRRHRTPWSSCRRYLVAPHPEETCPSHVAAPQSHDSRNR